ncbi:hypothetical protein ACK4CS_13675 [Enterococcus gallinarum]|uniref:hypothetical protein n=2 Tax=Enterococcus TaxID=1350 RepID=UPI0004964C24|nr:MULTISPECIES: hypothetical protein [Enterococcus]TKL06482.1 hypothetical protein DVW06_08020 [Enterococcus sp. ARL09-542]MBS7179608.1 hypothetical protein [Enterococcus gallinarum]MDV7742182.1 hypothetical protein [Enterococcus gallinarum]RGC49674.1 hypothetical protein DXA88_01330 [Enterococcus gallinarum]TXW60257.1 hypothetical protein D4M64_10865 [Enterococcus gallinarum]
MMQYNDIGGFFALEKKADLFSFSEPTGKKSDNVEYTLSGRAAYQLVLEDYFRMHGHYPKRVFFPDYCCLTMLQPFIEKDINIFFYKVNYDSKQKLHVGKLDTSIINSGDMFVFMSYFGFSLGNEDYIESMLCSLIERNVILIEDITHSYFRTKHGDILADYQIASLRKWCAVASGGEARKNNGRFLVIPYKDSNEIVSKQWQYMLEKSKNNYLTNQRELYEMNALFNRSLSNFDWRYKIDNRSLNFWNQVDFDNLIKIRRENAKVIVTNFKDSRFEPMFDYKNMDVPLFLPYKFHGDLSKLKNKLSRKGVYLPTHWPIHLSGTSNIWENEISLVCDQRYSVADMKFMIDNITNVG